MVPNPNFEVPILEYRIPLDSGRLISLYFASFVFKIPLESSYLVCKSVEVKMRDASKGLGLVPYLILPYYSILRAAS